jgi:excinuclease ABC subunit B
MPVADLTRLISALEEEMRDAAGDLRFEYAARLRDEMADLKKELKGLSEIGVAVK